MKAFTIFTTDVSGEMRPRRASAKDSCEVIPAGGQLERKGSAVARLERACQDALLEAKIDRIAELAGRITAARNRPILDYPGAGPSASELAAEHRAADWTRLCAEAEAAYAARNPHKKEGLQ